MDRLNLECLEHIFGFLNCGPKEWLLLSKVCVQWEDAVSRFWKRINFIEFSDDLCADDCQVLSRKQLTDIMEYAAQYITEIIITKHRDISHIKLGNCTYNMRSLNIQHVLKLLAKYSSGQILKANVLPNEDLLKYLMEKNQDLIELNLTLNKDSFANPRTACNNYDLRSKKKKWIESMLEKPRLRHKFMCAGLCRQILNSFGKLERLTVTLLSDSQQNFDMYKVFVSLLSIRKDGPQECWASISLL